MTLKLDNKIWTQVGGDMCPDSYGGILARLHDGTDLELLEIQPVREHLCDSDAADVGYPFWTREAWYVPSDLSHTNEDVQFAMKYVGLEREELDAMPGLERCLAIALACLASGHLVEEGPSGWSKDVLGDTRVRWWATSRPRGHSFLVDEDREFRAMLREAN